MLSKWDAIVSAILWNANVVGRQRCHGLLSFHRRVCASEARDDFFLLLFKRIFTSLLAAIERKMLNKNMNGKKMRTKSLIVSISRIFSSFELLFPLLCQYCWCFYFLLFLFFHVVFHICMAVDVTAAAAAIFIAPINTSAREKEKYAAREAARFLCCCVWWCNRVTNIATTKSSTSADDSRTHFHFILSAPMQTLLHSSQCTLHSVGRGRVLRCVYLQ